VYVLLAPQRGRAAASAIEPETPRSRLREARLSGADEDRDADVYTPSSTSAWGRSVGMESLLNSTVEYHPPRSPRRRTRPAAQRVAKRMLAKYPDAIGHWEADCGRAHHGRLIRREVQAS